MRRGTKVTGIVLFFVAALSALLLIRTTRHGVSALDEPTRIEHVLARAMRHYATPSDLRERKNPVPLTQEALAEGRAHFADHCAPCHGNDGKGQTAMGPKFYPRVPDMTLDETQSQSDGAIFATIENGVRLTGMPGWGDGTAESAYGSWTLVHFIRHLPKIREEELSEMERLNPKTLAEWEALREEEAFLAGGEAGTREAMPAESKPHHH